MAATTTSSSTKNTKNKKKDDQIFDRSSLGTPPQISLPFPCLRSRWVLLRVGKCSDRTIVRQSLTFLLFFCSSAHAIPSLASARSRQGPCQLLLPRQVPDRCSSRQGLRLFCAHRAVPCLLLESSQEGPERRCCRRCRRHAAASAAQAEGQVHAPLPRVHRSAAALRSAVVLRHVGVLPAPSARRLVPDRRPAGRGLRRRSSPGSCASRRAIRISYRSDQGRGVQDASHRHHAAGARRTAPGLLPNCGLRPVADLPDLLLAECLPPLPPSGTCCSASPAHYNHHRVPCANEASCRTRRAAA